MKEDPIKKLIQESKLETSVDFTDRTMDLLERRIQRGIKIKLYLLLSFVTVFFSIIAFTLIQSGFKVDVFGLIILLPKVATMVVISLIGYFVFSHLSLLIQFHQQAILKSNV